MKKIQFDSGIQEFKINGKGVLRFHPGDPNVYARFLEADGKIQKIGQELAAEAEKSDAEGLDLVCLMEKADRQMKQVLNWVFGEDNDFDRILGGVNMLAVAGNGEQVITNLLAALEPVLVEGARKCAQDQADLAAAQAEMRRKQQ